MGRRRLECTVQIVSPMFLGGGLPSEIDLRPAPFVAGLRWWFRAGLGGLVSDWRKVRELEADVFGDTASGRDFPVRVRPGNLGKPQEYNFSGRGLTYLAYGLGGPPRRGFYEPRKTFTISMPLFDSHHGDAVAAALWLFVILGGVGARLRRGFGALRPMEVTGLDGWKLAPELFRPPGDENALLRTLTEGLKVTRGIFADLATQQAADFRSIPEYSVVAPGHWSLKILEREFPSWQDALEVAGQRLREFRVDRNSGKAPYFHSHDYPRIIEGLARPVSGLKFPIFGLPQNYQSRSGSLKAAVTGRRQSRRASPLFIRLFELADHPKPYRLAFMKFHARFLPKQDGAEKDELVIAGGARHSAGNVDWSVLDQFLEQFKGPMVEVPS